MRKKILLILLLPYFIYSQCEINPYDDNATLLYPTPNQDPVVVNFNWIFLTKSDGTGNFDKNNSRHIALLEDMEDTINRKMRNILNQGDCTVSNEIFIGDSKIEIRVNKIWVVDEAWDYLTTGFVAGEDPLGSVLYSGRSTYYYKYLNELYPLGVAVVFANNGSTYEKLVNGDTSEFVIEKWASSSFPYYNVDVSLKQFIPDLYNKYLYSEMTNIDNGLVNYASKTLVHENGHIFGLYHNDCENGIMNGAWASTHTYLSPDEIGRMHLMLNCTSVSQYVVSTPLGVNYVQNNPEIVVYPNPNHGEVFINGLVNKGVISIFDVRGRNVMNGEINENESLNISNLSSGMYFIRIKTGGLTIDKKIMKI